MTKREIRAEYFFFSGFFLLPCCHGVPAADVSGIFFFCEGARSVFLRAIK
jgi:hypothetical protein